MSSQDVITFVREQVAKGISLKKICENLMENCLAPASDYGGLGCDNMTVLIVAILNGKSYPAWAEMVTSRVAESAPVQAAYDDTVSEASTQPADSMDAHDGAREASEEVAEASPTEAAQDPSTPQQEK